jgi:peptidoglycan/xylan/chitin deacetylase (PgdA/CDA1 family)
VTLASAVVLAAGLALTLAMIGSGTARTRARARARPRRVSTLVAGLYPVRPRATERAPASGAPTSAESAEVRRLLGLGLPIYCAGRRGNEIALTFDDGPGVYTHYALEKLTQAHERATFFVVGRSIESWPRWLSRELRVAAIGDHTLTHPDLLGLSRGEVRWQLRQTAELIRAHSGEDAELWRPPYGASDAAIERIAAGLGLLEVRWDVDSRDWLGADWSQIIANVEAGLRPGAVVLMHENRGQTIHALSTLLPYLHRRRLRSVTVPELLTSDPPTAAQVRRGLGGCGEPARVLQPGMLGGS